MQEGTWYNIENRGSKMAQLETSKQAFGLDMIGFLEPTYERAAPTRDCLGRAVVSFEIDTRHSERSVVGNALVHQPRRKKREMNLDTPDECSK